MIKKKELMVRICQLEQDVDYILEKLDKKVKKTVKKVKDGK